MSDVCWRFYLFQKIDLKIRINHNISQEWASLHNQNISEKLCLDNLWGPVFPHNSTLTLYAKEEKNGAQNFDLPVMSLESLTSTEA